ncbi:hypothetical protein [Bradyrhizobium japonicum]|nr:hypothetical protein [Bradyrhizobium japonicum]
MDWLSWAMAAYALIALGITTIVIAWPLEGERGEVLRLIRARWPRVRGSR